MDCHHRSGGADGATPGPGDGALDGGTPISCGDGPAYIHGDLWAFWWNFRVACAAQHRWLWICEQRFGEGSCPVEQQRFDDCWSASGDFPTTSWGGDSTPTPYSPNYGVCQPHHWSEKNDEGRRPGNQVPCDVRTYDYDALRTSDPRFGVDWWAGGTSMRHLTLKVFEAGTDPSASEGQLDGLAVLSTHPDNRAAYTDGFGNHGLPGGTRAAGCLPALTGEDEDPWPHQNFGAFFWLEVPTDRPVTLAASWIGPISDDAPIGCITGLNAFPDSFGYHSEDGKPWLISTPCWDFQHDVRFEPGRHYVWDLHGLRMLPGCDGPPDELLSVVPEAERAALRDGSCR